MQIKQEVKYWSHKFLPHVNLYHAIHLQYMKHWKT